MKTQSSVLLFAIVLAVSSPLLAAEAHHHHDSHEAARLQFNAGKKWATDQALRQAMGGINGAMAKALPAIHHNQFGDGEYQALAATVAAQVANVMANCKLDAKADAMLHLLIAELMAGAELMEGKTAQPRHDGAVRVLEALKSYGKYFQHPGWKVAKG